MFVTRLGMAIFVFAACLAVALMLALVLAPDTTDDWLERLPAKTILLFFALVVFANLGILLYALLNTRARNMIHTTWLVVLLLFVSTASLRVGMGTLAFRYDHTASRATPDTGGHNSTPETSETSTSVLFGIIPNEDEMLGLAVVFGNLVGFLLVLQVAVGYLETKHGRSF